MLEKVVDHNSDDPYCKGKVINSTVIPVLAIDLCQFINFVLAMVNHIEVGDDSNDATSFKSVNLFVQLLDEITELKEP